MQSFGVKSKGVQSDLPVNDDRDLNKSNQASPRQLQSAPDLQATEMTPIGLDQRSQYYSEFRSVLPNSL